MDNSYRTYILFAGVIFVIILSGLVYYQFINQNSSGQSNTTTDQGTASLNITSANSNAGYQNITNAYTLNANLHIAFTGQMHFNSYAALTVCSFDLKLNSSTWKVVPVICSYPTSASETFSGSHDFSLSFGIEPVTNTTVSVPFNLSFMVYSSQFNATSQYYNLAVS